MFEAIRNFISPPDSPSLNTHTIYAEIHANDQGNWVLFFYDCDGDLVLERTGKAKSKEDGIKSAVAARIKHQGAFKRIAA